MPLWALALALAGALALLYGLFQGEATRFDEAALGPGTTSVYARLDGDQVHCRTIVDARDCLAPAEARGLPRRALWLANSQLHGINQLAGDQQPASGQVTAALRGEGVEVLSFSQPNASLAEHYVLYTALARRMDIDVLVLPVVFDDTREGEIRTGIGRAADDGGVRAALERTEPGRQILRRIDATVEAAPDPANATLQQQSEDAITGALDACCGWEQVRGEARGSVRVSLRALRNTVFGIRPTSKRRRIPARYALNLGAYRETLAAAKAAGTRVVVYVAPLRSDAPRPYVTAEYEAFKRETAEIAAGLGARFLDLEDLVPNEYWGSKAATTLGGEAELDFMHFQAAGHERLAGAIAAAVRETLGGS